MSAAVEPRAEPRVMPDSLGFYFAGLVDGEGCFYIGKGGCRFIIKMRADDTALLEELRREINGIGTIRRVTSDGDEATRTRRPQVCWTVTRKRELVFLTRLFDAYPLRSKKARDYAVWREAVIDWSAGMPPAELLRYKRRLAEIRTYDESRLPGAALTPAKETDR